MIFRSFDLHSENVAELIGLQEAGFGRLDRAVWNWKYLRHPLSSDLRVFVAEDAGRLVASTTRMPADFLLGRRTCRGYFNVDSVVHPEYRRRGIMRMLYERTKALSLLISKGTTPPMYALLMGIGFHEIQPNTYLAKRSAHLKLPLRAWKAVGLLGRLLDHDGRGGLVRVSEFGQDFDEFSERVEDCYAVQMRKSSRYMSWRYLQHPRRKYAVFCRYANGRTACWMVVRARGLKAYLVDVLWDCRVSEEPAVSLSSLVRLLARSGYREVLCWTTNRAIRTALEAEGFADEGETPNLAVFGPTGLLPRFLDGNAVHLVDGDGDCDSAVATRRSVALKDVTDAAAR